MRPSNNDYGAYLVPGDEGGTPTASTSNSHVPDSTLARTGGAAASNDDRLDMKVGVHHDNCGVAYRRIAFNRRAEFGRAEQAACCANR